MYNFIINPETGQETSIYGKLGKLILLKYLNHLEGGAGEIPEVDSTKIEKEVTNKISEETNMEYSELNYPQGIRRIYFPSDEKFKKCSVIKRVMKGGVWEKKITQKIYKDCKKGTIAIDIGANIGAHTISMLDGVSPGGYVIAFEPQIEIATGLINTLNEINGNFTVSRMLVSNKNSTSKFMSNGTGMSRIPLENGHYNKNWSESIVETTTLDSFLEGNNEKVSLIKIDVEGHEFEVLEGAQETINKNKPIIYIEVWKDKGDYIKLTEWCSANNYDYEAISPNDYKLVPREA
jgi:FkbM family methyltransferase